MEVSNRKTRGDSLPFPEGNSLSDAARRRLERLLDKPSLSEIKKKTIRRKLGYKT